MGRQLGRAWKSRHAGGAMDRSKSPPGLQDMLDFGAVEAILGRRSRRFFLGAEIPDGVFAYKSRHDPLPLSDLEKLLVLTACGGNTGWHNMHYRARRYAPHLSNYSAAAGGRTFPASAGFHTSMTFFTDDEGVYVLDARDAPAFAERKEDGSIELEKITSEVKRRTRKLREGRLDLPNEVPFTEPHNTWVANRPGTLLVIPVGDLAQHFLLTLCYLAQNGLAVRDDVNRRDIPGIDGFKRVVDPDNAFPLSLAEQQSMAELTVELSTSCFAGALLLQAMGLGGWMYDGLDPFSVLGASGNPKVSGLGFRYDKDERWPFLNPTGLPGVMEGFCPPYYRDMSSAVEAVVRRKFGPGGPFNPVTPGPWRDSPAVRSSARVHSEEFKECVALQAQYVFDTFGKFPGTVPSIFVVMYLQAHHLDLEFYDKFYEPGAYLRTHADHMERWHAGEESIAIGEMRLRSVQVESSGSENA
jgi:hypothetical protein